MSSPENFVSGGAEAQSAIQGEIAKTDRSCPAALRALEIAYHVGPDPYRAAADIALNGSTQERARFEQQLQANDAERSAQQRPLTVESAQQQVEDAFHAA